MTKVLQHTLPYDLRQQKPLPGIAPLTMEDWLQVDESYAGQMALRADLINKQRDKVIALAPEAFAAAEELLQLVLDQLPALGFARHGEVITRPDGVQVPLNWQDPMGTLGLLLQEDLCLLQKRGDEHVLTGAVLCFPSSWTLAQKFQKPLLAIHTPVDSYDDNIARRVQRLFDGIQPDRPLWRFNILWYATHQLHYPREEYDTRGYVSQQDAPYLRSERQCLVRLPESRAVVFSIHTFMLEGDRGRQLMQHGPDAKAAGTAL